PANCSMPETLPPAPWSAMTAGTGASGVSGKYASRRMGLPPLWKTVGDCTIWGIREFGNAFGVLVMPSETRQAASLRQSFLDLVRQLAQRLLIRRTGYAAFGDDGGHVFCGGYVEGGVLDLDSVGHHLLAGNMRDFSGAALL